MKMLGRMAGVWLVREYHTAIRNQPTKQPPLSCGHLPQMRMRDLIEMLLIIRIWGRQVGANKDVGSNGGELVGKGISYRHSTPTYKATWYCPPIYHWRARHMS